MKFNEIAAMPTTRECRCAKTHESVYRSYQILQKVKQLLTEGVPPTITLELIAAMEDKTIWSTPKEQL